MNENATAVNACTVCGEKNVRRLLKIDDVPVFCNVLLDTKDEALEAPKGNIDLLFCPQCGHAFNSAFDPALMAYSPAYDNSLHFSSRFQKYVDDLVDRLVSTYQVNDKTVIDIGCGKGDFLKLICDQGNNQGIGFDPSFEPDRLGGVTEKQRFKVVKDYYSEKYAGQHADLICCRQVLEHIEQPTDFIDMVVNTIDGKRDTIVFFEVPNVMYTFEDLGIWDLIYEHCGYFSRASLTHLFREQGLYPLNVEESFGGQYLCIEAKLGTPDSFEAGESDGSLTFMTPVVEQFTEQYNRKVAQWRERLNELNRSGKRTVIWGSGSKGVTFLNVLKDASEIDWAVDISPHKQGNFIPGSGQEVISPDRLKAIQPTHVLVMNQLYQNEIKEMLGNLELACEVELV